MLKFLREQMEEGNVEPNIVRGTLAGTVAYEVHVGSSRLRIAVLDAFEQRFLLTEDWLTDDLAVEYGESVETLGLAPLARIIQQFIERADQP